ncbi:MAG: hypothetical protein PHW02_08365 [bacterium]|nr:hypothetical protein [bacterium]
MSDQFLQLAENCSYIAVTAIQHEGIIHLIDKLKKEYIAEGFEDFDFVEIFGDTTTTEDAVSRSMAPPMVSKRKLIVLKNPEFLSKNAAEEIDRTFASFDKSSIAIIVCIDEFAGSMKNVTRSAEERFPSAKIYQHTVQRSGAREEMRKFIKDRKMQIPDKTAEILLERCGGNINNVLNILNMRYISGEESVSDFDVESLVDVDFSQNLQYKVSDNFFRRDRKNTMEALDKVIKWNVMNIDGIVLLLMREIEKVRNPFRNDSGFSNNEAKKWKERELDAAFENFYALLRDLRTYSGAYSEMLLRQCIINIFERG